MGKSLGSTQNIESEALRSWKAKNMGRLDEKRWKIWMGAMVIVTPSECIGLGHDMDFVEVQADRFSNTKSLL